MLEADPVAWLAYLGIHPHGPVEVVDSELSTVTAESDKVFRVNESEPYLVHIEIQSSADATLPRRLLRYNALLDYRHDVRVWSVAVLLRPEAESSTITGVLELRLPDGRPIHDFRYGVMRVWQQDAESVLLGPLGTLPLALLADFPQTEARLILARIEDRLIHEAPPADADRSMKSTYLLSGLRFERAMIDSLFSGVDPMWPITKQVMRDSSTGAWLLKCAEAGALCRAILAQGTQRFGTPPDEIKARLKAVEEPEILEPIMLKILSAESWDELVPTEETTETDPHS
jgi:hypothetical protein